MINDASHMAKSNMNFAVSAIALRNHVWPPIAIHYTHQIAALISFNTSGDSPHIDKNISFFVQLNAGFRGGGIS